MKKLIPSLIGLLFFACTAEEVIDPIVGTWRATVYKGYNVEKDLTFIFYSSGTLDIIEEPLGYPNCVLGCGGSWTNVTPTQDFNSSTQAYRIDMVASICMVWNALLLILAVISFKSSDVISRTPL